MQVLDLETEKGEWGFKALKQMIKINFKLVSNKWLYWSLACYCSYLVVIRFRMDGKATVPNYGHSMELKTSIQPITASKITTLHSHGTAVL